MCVCVCVCMCVCVGGEGLRNVSKVGSGARVPRPPRIILFVSSSGTLLVPQATDFGHSPQAPPTVWKELIGAFLFCYSNIGDYKFC